MSSAILAACVVAFGLSRLTTGRWLTFWAARLLLCVEAVMERAWASAVVAARDFRANYGADLERIERSVARRQESLPLETTAA